MEAVEIWRAEVAADGSSSRRCRSMTPRERRDPQVLNGSRRRRIAAGSGTALTHVNQLVKQFGEMQKMMKQLSGGGRRGAAAALMNRR